MRRKGCCGCSGIFLVSEIPGETGVHRLCPVSDHFWYETEEEVLRGGDKRLSMSFCGIWSFLRVPNPEAVPAVFDVTDQVQAGGAWAHEPYILDSSKDREFHFSIQVLA